MSQIVAYDVELRIQGDKPRLSVRTEYAYSLMDALQQAMFAEQAESGAALGSMTVQRVGPPAEAIRVATVAMKQQIDDVLQAITKSVKAIGVLKK